MSYVKNVWQSGDLISTEKLNHMEDGIASAGGGFVIGATIDYNTGVWTLDKTWNEIKNAMDSGTNPFVLIVNQEDSMSMIWPVLGVDGYGTYSVMIYNFSNPTNPITAFEASDVDDYPTGMPFQG